ncbi:hypothetical protein MNO14_01040 [Luteimonas sp. S4-F44]|uniref:hypothetical protein n=1 Tax=Luteimonas sp. S4-F44 TaxID=2925842 RepID=UPI001F53395D|nr:hypothetical protein [Luteimonas sp. S4-F44]UNK42724.1 hypothetical protein MNO14_01040 [Luteimonas sp. S4-F44]
MTLQGLLAVALSLAAATAGAQTIAPERKVYCWDEGGRRVCGDALPASAVNAARTEIDARSGVRTAEIGRALTDEERSAAEAAQAQAQREADARGVLQRRELAMVEAYATEADLRRAYGERIVLVEEAIKTSQLGIANLRASLLSLLRQAADLELRDAPVDATLIAGIRAQRTDLERQTAVLEQQLADQAALGGDLRAALARYRELKQPAAAVHD